MMKKISSILIMLSIVFGMLTAVNASTSIKVGVNGTSISLSAQPFAMIGVVYLPANDTVAALKGKLSVSKNIISVEINNIRAQVTVSSKTATIDGKKVTLKNSPVLKDKNIYFPINLYSNFKVNYTYKNNIVNFSTASTGTTKDSAQFINKYPVYINGFQTTISVKVKSGYNSTMYIALKQLSQAMNYKIDSVQDGLSIQTDTATVVFYTNSDSCEKNGVKQKMNLKTEAIDGDLLVPITFLSNVFDVYTEVSFSHNCLYIVSKAKTSETQYSNDLKSNNGNEGYFDCSISGNTLNVKGKTQSSVWVVVEIKNGITSVPVQADVNGLYSVSISLAGMNGEKYGINIYTAPQQYNVTYNSIYIGIPFEKVGSDFQFKVSPILEDNRIQMVKDSSIEPDSAYTAKTDNIEISNLVDSLVANISDSRQKVKVIHDWVAANIYYDEDSLNNNTASTETVTAEATFTNKRSVCEGYARLFMAMAIDAGIPCRLISGKAIWLSEGNTWENVDQNDANHAWNEVYLDGRWVIIDVTWDSGNTYENGVYTAGETNYAYFDPTLEFFSMDHKIIGR